MHDSNFRVFVRCRAKNPEEPLAYGVAPPTGLVRKGASDKEYSFDRVFSPDQSQDTVFEICAQPLVDEFLRGYNGTMFAYGQTGTGKTYTMTGNCESTQSPSAGIVPRVLQSVFDKLENSQRDEWSLELRYIELYNEELRDLLDPSPPTAKQRGAKQLRIAENQLTHSTEVFGATSHAVTSCASALAVIRSAQARRQTAATLLNSDSSRSHSVLTLVLVCKEPVSGMAVRSKLHLVDLAGSESVAKSGALRQRAIEAGEINKSLLALGRVIEALVDAEKVASGKPRYISYRASKLTHLLQDSLGGATKTSMIATVSISAQDADETRSTLDYALRARSIKNQQQTEVELLETLPTIREMSRRLEEVQRELTAQRTRDGCVCISTTRYEHLAASEQRAANFVAQHETATRHERARVEQMQQENARLETQLAELAVEHRMCSTAAMTHTRLQQAIATLSSASHKNAVTASETCNALFAKLSELPSALSKSLVELRTTVESQALGPSTSLHTECKTSIHTAFEARSSECNTLVSTLLRSTETQLTESLSTLMAAWKQSVQDLHRPLKDAATLITHLVVQIENIQERVAKEQAANSEAVALARDLMAREHKHAEVLKQLQEASQDRQALTRRLIDSGKASNVQLPLLSARAASAGECVTNIAGVLNRPTPELSTIVRDQAAAELSRLAARVPKTLSEQLSQLETDITARIHSAIATNDEHVQGSERLRVEGVSQLLGDLKRDIGRSVDQYKPDVASLTNKNSSIAADLAKFQQQARSMPPSPQRAAQATSFRSPGRTRRSRALQAPTGSPRRGGTCNPELACTLIAKTLGRRPKSGPTQRMLALGLADQSPSSDARNPKILRDIGNRMNVQLGGSDVPKLLPLGKTLVEPPKSSVLGQPAYSNRSDSRGDPRRSPQKGGPPPPEKRIKRE